MFVLGATVRLSHLYTTRDYEEWYKGKVSNQAVLDAFDDDRDAFLEAMRIGRLVHAQRQILLTRTAAGAGFYVIARVNQKTTVEQWFDGLATGADVPRGDPRHALRRGLNNAAQEGTAGKRSQPPGVADQNVECVGRGHCGQDVGVEESRVHAACHEAGPLMPRSLRRHPLRDASAAANLSSKIGTHTAWVFYRLVEQPAVDYNSALALAIVAHHHDLMDAASNSAPTYPEDVADLMGTALERAMAHLQTLTRGGLLTGNRQAGYRLAGPMVKPASLRSGA